MGRGLSLAGVLGSADLWAAVQETDWSQVAFVLTPDLVRCLSPSVSPSVEWDEEGTHFLE